MSLLKRSPKQFIELYVLGHEGYVSEAMKRGSVLHDLMRSAALRLISPKEVEESFRTKYPELRNAAESVFRLANYVSRLNIVYAENELTFDYDKYKFVGILDLVYETQDGIVLADYKFSNAEKYSPDHFQLKFYNLIWKLNQLPDLNRALFFVCYLKHNKIDVVEVDLKDSIQVAIKEVKWYIDKIKHLELAR